jgi:hypothetical protein
MVKTFIQKLLLFLLPVICSLVLLEALLRIIPNNYKYKRTELLTKAQKIEILALGSSHTLYGINPEYFTMPGFNLANTSQSLNYDYKLLKKYGNELESLKVVIIPISYFSLFGNLDKGVESWRIKNYVLYYQVTPSTFNIKNYCELFNDAMYSHLSRLYRYVTHKSSITVSDTGFGLEHSSKKKIDKDASGEAASLRHTVEDWEYLDYNKEMLQNIITYCDARNIALVFVTLPAYYTYRNRLDESQLNETVTYMTDIGELYNNVYYYNYLNDPMFIEDDFFDADHLNELGAEKLTKKLNELIMVN